MEAEDKFTTELVSTSPQLNELLAALSVAQSTIKPAKKTGKNPHLRNDYAKLEDVWDVARPVLKATGLSITHLPTTVGNQAGVIQILGHSSGQWIRSMTMLTISQGRGTNAAQACGICYSYARRYAISGTLGICTGEDTDGAVQTDRDGKGGTWTAEDPKMRALVDKKFQLQVKVMQEDGTSTDRVREVLKQGGYSRLSEIPLNERDAFLGLISPKSSNEPAPLL